MCPDTNVRNVTYSIVLVDGVEWFNGLIGSVRGLCNLGRLGRGLMGGDLYGTAIFYWAYGTGVSVISNPSKLFDVFVLGATRCVFGGERCNYVPLTSFLWNWSKYSQVLRYLPNLTLRVFFYQSIEGFIWWKNGNPKIFGMSAFKTMNSSLHVNVENYAYTLV